MIRSGKAYILSFDGIAGVNEWSMMNPSVNRAFMTNPTVDGLIFMDCAPNPKKKNRRGLFACYVTGVEKDPKTNEATALQIGLVQWVKGIPQIFIVKISREQIEKGDKVRFWNTAPTFGLLDEHPFPVSSDAEQKEEKKET